jgi:hypothetical protein
VDDDCYVNVAGMLEYHSQHLDQPFYYGGFVNSFTLAPESYQHKYYAPYAQQGTVFMSRQVAETVAREIGLIKPLAQADATLGHFLASYSNGKPQHNDRFVGDIEKTYFDIASPLVVKGCDEETMRSLARGEPLIGRAKEMKTRGIFVDPYPKDPIPECYGVDGKDGCNFPLKMLDAEH